MITSAGSWVHIATRIKVDGTVIGAYTCQIGYNTFTTTLSNTAVSSSLATGSHTFSVEVSSFGSNFTAQYADTFMTTSSTLSAIAGLS
jgi:hypothetical protein